MKRSSVLSHMLRPLSRRPLRILCTVACAAAFLTGCDTGFQTMGATEYGVRFRALPPPLGGISSSVISKGETVLVWPWESVYRVDTGVRLLEWGDKGDDTDAGRGDFVQTRALDGNEVALAVSIEYRVTSEKEKIPELVQRVATEGETIDEFVQAVARADLRTTMNELNTADFLVVEKKFQGQEKAEERMRTRLAPFGIEIMRVNLKDHRFERLLPDGSLDSTYQRKIDEEKILEEDTKREKQRVETVRRQKEVELNEAQAKVNRMLQDAEGYKQQAMLRGDGYFESRSNAAKAILATGQANVQGVTEQVNALKGPGGRAILKMRVVEALLKNNPNFIVLQRGENGAAMDLSKMDVNQLLGQFGVTAGAMDDNRPIPSVERRNAPPAEGTVEQPNASRDANNP